jgi:serine/threonine-protein kinase
MALIMVVIVGTFGVAAFVKHTGQGVVNVGAAWSVDGQRVILQAPDSAGSAAGVQVGDILVGIEGIPVITRQDRRHVPPIIAAPLGEDVTFTVERADGTIHNLTATASTPRLASGRVFANVFGLSAARVVALAFEIVVYAAFIVVAAILTLRRRDNLMALLLAAALMGLGARTSAFQAAMLQEYSEIGTLVMITTGYPAVIMIALYLIWFPVGRFRLRGDWALFLTYVLVELFFAFAANAQLYFAVVPFFYTTMVVLLVRRYRREFSASQRQQSKWLIIGVILGVIGFFMPGIVNAYVGDAAYITIYALGRLCLLGVPVTMAFAVFRYRLYEVDLVLNRGIAYAGIAAALGIVFFAVFAGLQMVLGGLLGTEPNGVAVALSTAAAILLYNPARKWIQSFVDRRVFGLRVGMDAMQREADWERDHTARLGKRISQTLEVAKIDPQPADGARQIGGYTLGGVLGRGGMGEVYQGEHHSTGDRAAIKILRGDMAGNAEVRARFEREAKTLAALNHPNIVRIIGYGVDDALFYMVLEYIEGQTLAEYLQKHKPLPLDTALPLLADVAAALDYAHAHHIVHRDVKPRNVMLRRSDGGVRAVLMDFGIVKWVDGTASLGGALTNGEMIGTVDYAAPEQITAANEIDARADIYALGVMAYAMLTGEMPYKGNVGQIIFAHLQQPPPDPRKCVPDLPEATAAAIIRCMAKKPDARFATAGAFVGQLQIAAAQLQPE